MFFGALSVQKAEIDRAPGLPEAVAFGSAREQLIIPGESFYQSHKA